MTETICHVHSCAKNSIKDYDLISATTSCTFTNCYVCVKLWNRPDSPHYVPGIAIRLIPGNNSKAVKLVGIVIL